MTIYITRITGHLSCQLYHRVMLKPDWILKSHHLLKWSFKMTPPTPFFLFVKKCLRWSMSFYSMIIIIAVIQITVLLKYEPLSQKLKKISLTHSASILMAMNMKYYGYKIGIFEITFRPIFLGSIYLSRIMLTLQMRCMSTA